MCLLSHLFLDSRHFMVAKDGAAPGAATDGCAPLYVDKFGRSILCEQRRKDELQ